MEAGEAVGGMAVTAYDLKKSVDRHVKAQLEDSGVTVVHDTRYETGKMQSNAFVVYRWLDGEEGTFGSQSVELAACARNDPGGTQLLQLFSKIEQAFQEGGRIPLYDLSSQQEVHGLHIWRVEAGAVREQIPGDLFSRSLFVGLRYVGAAIL